MIINKAILHIFDFISEVCIFSQKEIDLREDNINEFIKKHIKNVLSDSNSKEGTLKINSSFLTKLNEYNYGRYDFCSFSQAIGKELYAQISLSDKKESMDFLFVDFTEDNQDFLGLVFLGYKRAYTHQVMQSDTIVYNTLITTSSYSSFHCTKGGFICYYSKKLLVCTIYRQKKIYRRSRYIYFA